MQAKREEVKNHPFDDETY